MVDAVVMNDTLSQKPLADTKILVTIKLVKLRELNTKFIK